MTNNISDATLIAAERLKPFKIILAYLNEYDEGVGPLDIARGRPTGYYPGRTQTVEIAGYFSDQEEASDWVKTSLRYAYGPLKGIQVVAAGDLDQHAEPDAIADAAGEVKKLESAIQAERDRHTRVMADLENRYAAARAELVAARHSIDSHARRHAIANRDPGVVSRLDAIRCELLNATHRRMQEERNVATGKCEARIKARRGKIDALQSKIDKCTSLLAEQAVKNAEIIRQNQRKFRGELAAERQKLVEAEAENAARKPLDWHRERMDRLADEYNALVAACCGENEQQPAEQCQDQHQPELAAV